MSFIQVYDTPPTNRWQQPVPVSEESESIYNTPRAVPLHTEQGSEVKERHDTVSIQHILNVSESQPLFVQSLLNGSYVSLTNEKFSFLRLRATPVFHCCELIPSVCRLPLAQLVTPVCLRRSSWCDTLFSILY